MERKGVVGDGYSDGVETFWALRKLSRYMLQTICFE